MQLNIHRQIYKIMAAVLSRYYTQINEWTPPRKSGGIPRVSTGFSLSMEMSRLARHVAAKPVSRDQILRRERGPANIHFPCSADHEYDWQQMVLHSPNPDNDFDSPVSDDL